MDPAGTPAPVKTWQVTLTGLSVITGESLSIYYLFMANFRRDLAVVAIVVMLTLFHKRHRLQRSREIREYYEEQIGYVA